MFDFLVLQMFYSDGGANCKHSVHVADSMPFLRAILLLLRIDRNFCPVHEEITSITLHTPCNPRTQIAINRYKLIQTFFVIILKNILIFSK